MKKPILFLVSLVFMSCTSSTEIYTISNKDAKKVYREMVKQERDALKKYGSMKVVYDSLYTSKF